MIWRFVSYEAVFGAGLIIGAVQQAIYDRRKFNEERNR